ncbi:serine/threonine-protein kinase GRIK1-like [Iris pallida]|uniref:non-specific serine/threonine protein kinase n=1 Tax=Iris pallida TaxID=29817 RepID=A0AAX6F016_IRIPA|nr:serine/threonine-protein kinase GRIK1-like [Iris pallida]
MSRMMLADFDRDVGCCSCLGFLRMAGREMDSFTGEHPDFLLDEGYRKRTVFPAKDRAICRDKPVKETAHLTRSEDSDGYKMVNEYVRQGTIGRGSYGKVVLYRSINDGMQYAIKAFYKSRLSKVRVSSSETAMTDVHREVSIMKLLEHPNIINLVEVIDDPESDHFYMVLEYVEGKWICDASGACGGIGEYTARRYLRDIIAGLIYLHAHDIVHGDIKPENLLVTRNGTVKIGDFSVSQAFEDGNDELWRSPGTPVFTAPECCIGLSYHGKVADVWALGVTLYCMILGYCPFIGDSLQDTYDKIVDTPLYIPEEVDPELKDLLQGLLSKDPSQRLTLESAAKHPWVIREGGPIPIGSCRCKSESTREEYTSAGAKNDNGT